MAYGFKSWLNFSAAQSNQNCLLLRALRVSVVNYFPSGGTGSRTRDAKRQKATLAYCEGGQKSLWK